MLYDLFENRIPLKAALGVCVCRERGSGVCSLANSSVAFEET